MTGAVTDVALPDRTTSYLELVYQHSPLEEESRDSQTTLKKA